MFCFIIRMSVFKNKCSWAHGLHSWIVCQCMSEILAYLCCVVDFNFIHMHRRKATNKFKIWKDRYSAKDPTLIAHDGVLHSDWYCACLDKHSTLNNKNKNCCACASLNCRLLPDWLATCTCYSHACTTYSLEAAI